MVKLPLPSSAEELLRRYAAGERDFFGAHLTGAHLAGVSLIGGHLPNANLREANLQDAQLAGAYLAAANLTGANLQDARLNGARLNGAHLEGANLSGANLEGTNLTEANLTGANVQRVTLGGTHLASIDLSPFCEALTSLIHQRPSNITPSSVLLSVRAPRLKDFLAHAGVPEVFAEYMVDCALSMKDDVFRILRSTFISYGYPDEAFARQLYEALHRNGVVTFFFPEHAKAGEQLHRVVRDGVNKLDRVMLVCSAASLDRKGLLAELEETLARERRDGGAAYLIPITIDDYVFDGWKADVAQTVRDRVVADFRGADTDPAKFQSALIKLIEALKK